MYLALKANLEVVIEPSDIDAFEADGYRIVDTEKKAEKAPEKSVAKPVKKGGGK